MKRLTFEEMFTRRTTTKDPDLRDFLERAEQVRRSMPEGYDRDTAMVEELRILLQGGKTLRNAHSESLTKVAELAGKHASTPNSEALGRVARETSAYHYSRMR
jgi:hypothetical protein